MADKLLRATIKSANASIKAEKFIMNSRFEDGILILDRFIEWQHTVVNKMPDVMYVIFPSNRGGFNIMTVPQYEGAFVGRKGFPSKWLGNPDKTLGMTFCHINNFIASTQTLEQAINVAKIALAS